MMDVLKGKSPTKQPDQIDKLVYAVKMDQQLLPRFLHSKFRVGGEKIIRRIEVFDDQKIKEDALKHTLKRAESEDDQCINLNIGSEQVNYESKPDKSEFMKRGKRFIQALEEASLKTKSKLFLPKCRKAGQC